MKVAIAQIKNKWLNRHETTQKVISQIEITAKEHCSLVVFGEAFLPGYPFWLGLTNGAEFNSDFQKEMFAKYVSEAVIIERGDLDKVCNTCKSNNISCYLGIIERASDRGGHSLYCTLAYIDSKGLIQSTHRKLCPTYDERLVWSPGDGHGLRTHPLRDFTLGGLNCWENWMPLPRAALHAKGTNVHVAVWPGSERNTHDITRFIAKETRSYVISASTLTSAEMVKEIIPDTMLQSPVDEWVTDGGSCIAKPDGTWLIEPVVSEEQLIIAELDINEVLKERQNLDVSGHYARPDVLSLKIDDRRQSIIEK